LTGRRSKVQRFPEGSVKDAVRYDGPLADWITLEEAWLASVLRDFQLNGFSHDAMLVPAIFPMVDLVQHKNIHGADFFGPSIFVDYDEEPENDFPGSGSSHHSGWRLLVDRNKAGGIVLLAQSNPHNAIEILIEGKPPEEWVEAVIKTYYTARRAATVIQAFNQACSHGC
jgi:hypothetical protein